MSDHRELQRALDVFSDDGCPNFQESVLAAVSIADETATKVITVRQQSMLPPLIRVLLLMIVELIAAAIHLEFRTSHVAGWPLQASVWKELRS